MEYQIYGKDAHEMVKKAVSYVVRYCNEYEVYGGTIPRKIHDLESPNDFKRLMLEAPPITFILDNPRKNWCDISNHWVGITLRETQDTLMGLNPGYVTKYSDLYKRWLEKEGYFNYTYGERLTSYPYSYEENGFNQLCRCIAILKKHPTSRRACVSTWYPIIDLGHPYCPCNMVFQLTIRDGMLNWTTVIRSLDVLRGFTENIFMFTTWQRYVANELNVGVGQYITMAMNPHLYRDMEKYYSTDIYNVPNSYDINHSYNHNDDLPLKTMGEIDKLLFDYQNYHLCIEKAYSLSDYWKNWQLALISEYARIRKDYDVALDIYNELRGVFRFSVARRLVKHFNHIIEELPNEQRKYLWGVLCGETSCLHESVTTKKKAKGEKDKRQAKRGRA